jgi:hypothetical protein
MARHVFTREECSRGGKKSALHPNRKAICSMGFWACMEKRPFFARNHLKRKIHNQNAFKQRRAAMHSLVARTNTGGRRKPM